MANNKKRNNIITKRGNYYYRIRWYNDSGRQVERTISLMTKDKQKAKARGRCVKKEVDDIKDGTLQRFQFDDYFNFEGDGTSELISMTLNVIIPEYLAYKKSKVRAETVRRDKCSLNQLCEFIGYTKPVEELDCFDMKAKMD